MTILTWGYTPTYNQWDHLVGIYSRSKCLLVAIMIGMGCAPVGANPKNDDDFGPKAPLVEKTPFTDFFRRTCQPWDWKKHLYIIYIYIIIGKYIYIYTPSLFMFVSPSSTSFLYVPRGGDSRQQSVAGSQDHVAVRQPRWVVRIPGTS